MGLPCAVSPDAAGECDAVKQESKLRKNSGKAIGQEGRRCPRTADGGSQDRALGTVRGRAEAGGLSALARLGKNKVIYL